MDNPEEKVKKIKDLYQVISALLDEVDEFSFDETMVIVNNNLRLVSEIMKSLKNQYNNEDMIKFNAEIQPHIKQINLKFDNIIDAIKAEQSEISKELNNFQNQKKLANYNR